MLLFSQPGAYRRILAVTFTNKATDEMKTRIVQELYHLASGRASDYIHLLSSAYSLTERQGAGPEDSGRYPARLLRF